MKSKIIYLTYQTFPSDTANTIQTIDNAKYIYRSGHEIIIVFPLRSKFSSDNIEKLKKHYRFDENIEFKGIEHNLPFGKYNIFEKYLYLFSHFIWSKKITKTYRKDVDSNSIFFTRSDWIFYFLSKKGLNVTFECHQLTKLRKQIIKKSISNKSSKVIFLNQNLLDDSGLNTELSKKYMVLQNGVDTDLFKKENKNESKNFEIIFTGNIKRFNDDRGLKYIINSFLNEKMPEKFKLKIIGWPLEQINELRELVRKLKMDSRISIVDKLDRESTISNIQNADIGLLINSSSDKHSLMHTSPLKYFEYLYAGLNIVAVDFPSHRALPFSENISFFHENNEEEFIQALFESLSKDSIQKDQLKIITLEERVNKLLLFIK